MKNVNSILVAVLVLGAGILAGAGCKSSSEHQSNGSTQHMTQYTCPMHPEVVQDTPGKCPKCGMDLVEKQ